MPPTRHALVPLVLALAACTPRVSTPDAGADVASVDGATVERGPIVLPIEADPNGLWWDAASATLYIADDGANRVLAWRDGQGTTEVGELPTAPADGLGLGQLVRASDGTIYVTRFGFGTMGDVALLRPDGSSATILGLDPSRRRIGLGLADDGALYDGYFVVNGTTHAGAVASLLTTGGGETDAITGLVKPVGVLVVGSRLYVSDQSRGEILVADRAAPMAYTHFATLPGVDLLCLGPDGALFSGSLAGTVYRIGADGTPAAFDTGYQSTRGVAYDAANHRLFAADHDDDPSNGTTHFLHIVPVD